MGATTKIEPPKSAAKPVSPAKKTAEPKVVETPAALDWSALPPADIVQYVRTSPRAIDREASTPTVIKERVTKGFEATAKKGAPVYYTQACGDNAHAEEFLNLARKYATFREYTLRGKVLTDPEVKTLIANGVLPGTTRMGSVVSFAVKPKETRRKSS
jgi:hypothetical protein